MSRAEQQYEGRKLRIMISPCVRTAPGIQVDRAPLRSFRTCRRSAAGSILDYLAVENPHMKAYWIVALALMTGTAVAQSAAPEPTRATNGPAGTVERAHAAIAVDSNGNATGTSDTFRKTQSYSSGDGELSARTRIQTTGPATTIGK